jgi:hypothetical protein
MISYALINPFPRISHFTLLIIIGSLIFFLKSKNKTRGILIVLTGLMVGSYARPELFLSFIFLLTYYFFSIFKSSRSIKIRKEFLQFLIFLLIPAILVIFIGLPMFQGNERGFIAFSQHFSLNWVKWNDSNINSWINHQYIIQQNFGEINTIFEALKSNAAIFFKHIFSNIWTFLLYLASIFHIHANIFVPGKTMTNAYIEAVILACAILFLVIRRLLLRKAPIKNIFKNNMNLALVVLFIIIPFVMSSVLIYPRHHYLLIIGTMLIFFLSVILCTSNSTASKPSVRISLITGIILYLLTPCFHSNTTVLPDYKNNPKYEMLRSKIVTSIRSLNIEKQVAFMDAGEGYSVFLPENFEKATYDATSKETWTNDVESKVNMILINKELIKAGAELKNPYWKEFYRHYEDFGFIKFEIPEGKDYILLVNNELLKTAKK